MDSPYLLHSYQIQLAGTPKAPRLSQTIGPVATRERDCKWVHIGLADAKLAGSIPVWLHHNACLEAFLKRTDVRNDADLAA